LRLLLLLLLLLGPGGINVGLACCNAARTACTANGAA
jgi:hypothetical protein